jgi:hypothetical protein
MRYLIATSFLFMSFALLAADPVIKLPAEIKMEPGTFIKVTADTDCKLVKWASIDPGLSLFPNEELKNPKGTVVLAMAPGRYRLLAWSAKGDTPTDIVQTVIVVGNAPPCPPTPPTPPVPPTPPPVPPVPDALSAKLQAAFTADVGDPATKKAWLTSLKGVYEAVPGFIDKLPPGATMVNLLADYTSAVALVLPSREIIPKTRRAIADEVMLSLGDDGDVALDAVSKAKAKEVFNRVSRSLENVK